MINYQLFAGLLYSFSFRDFGELSVKFRSALTTALGAFAISILSTMPASAAAGWQSLGNSDFYPDAEGSGCHTNKFSSGGGYIKVDYYRPGHSDDITDLQVWEYDPDNPDDFIITLTVKDGWAPKETYVGNFTDGDNNKAEIYFRGPCTGAPWVHVED